jgi:mycofactocin precursor
MKAEVEQQLIEDDTAATGPNTATDQLVEDVLVEEVSIDGMCGVY